MADGHNGLKFESVKYSCLVDLPKTGVFCWIKQKKCNKCQGKVRDIWGVLMVDISDYSVAFATVKY